MTAVLIAATCIFLNLALSRAGMFYMDKLGQAIFHQTPTADFMIPFPARMWSSFLLILKYKSTIPRKFLRSAAG